MDVKPDDDKEMKLRYAGNCLTCGQGIPKGTLAIYNRVAKNVRHIDCMVTVDRGVAGASAQREYERRKAKDEARVAQQKAKIQDKFGTGFVGKVATLLAVDDRPRQTTEAWSAGASGEESVANWLEKLAEVGVIALHDRGIPGSRANIDHIAITPWGVWVIDAKRYAGKRPDFVVEGGLFGIGGVRRLTVGGRKRDNLIEGVLRQVEKVQAVLGDEVEVHGALAFVDADWPLLAGDFKVREVSVLWPKKLIKVMLREEPPTVDVERVAVKLAEVFRAA
jgi:hypothetical protein